MYPQHEIRFRLAWCRETGDKIDDAIGELRRTGNKMLFAILNAFFCVYCRVFLRLPSINNTNLLRFSFLTH